MKHNASQSRYLRKRYAKDGFDEQQEEQQKQFGQNLQKALDTFGNKGKKKDIESQVEYFGHMIQPFNMREEQDMGDIDGDGYFVFKRRGEYRDAWLESIEEGNDMMVADKVKKKIKTQGVTFKGLYDEDRKGDRADDQKINQADENEENDDGQDDQNDQRLNDMNKGPQAQQQLQPANSLNLQPTQLKQLICQLLPMNKSANTYIKQLKKKIKDPETKQLHDKILQLCNMYIQKTNEYDILTAKKEELEVQVDAGEEDEQRSDEIDWDDDGGSEDGDEQDDDGVKQKMEVKEKQEQKRSELNQGNNIKTIKDANIKKNTNNNQPKGNYSDDDIF